MKRIILIALILTSMVSQAQQYERKGAFIEVRADVEIEAEVLSHSLSVTLNENKDRNSYSALSHRTLSEQVNKLLFHLDSIGVKKADISEDKMHLSTNSYYKNSKKILVKNLTDEQVLSINKFNKDNTYVGDKKTVYRVRDTEEALIKRVMESAKKKAKTIAKVINKKVADVKYVVTSTYFEKEFEGTYNSKYYKNKYYVTVGFNIE